MPRTFIVGLTTGLTAFSFAALAQQAPNGSPAEARAMLDKAVAALKADKAKALEQFNKGEGGFKDRDLQPFCFTLNDGALVAATAPTLLGKDIRTLKDPTGKGFGQENYDAAKKPGVNEVRYMFPKPGETTPIPKVSFVTGIADVGLGCGVGYYP
jgi:signal transduction histidine kinase